MTIAAIDQCNSREGSVNRALAKSDLSLLGRLLDVNITGLQIRRKCRRRPPGPR